MSKKMVRVERYLTLDRNKNLKARKTNYRLDDGEISVKLILDVPVEFFSPLQIKAEAKIIIPEVDLPIPEVRVESVI